MSTFRYSKEELERNKVLKYNLDLSRQLQNDPALARTRSETDANIAASEALLASLGRSSETAAAAQAAKAARERPLEHQPQARSWESLVSEAENAVPGEIVLEDILSPEEIEASFRELDEINARFAQKTGIVNRTDLAFLAIATALQVTKTPLFPYVAKHFGYCHARAMEYRRLRSAWKVCSNSRSSSGEGSCTSRSGAPLLRLRTVGCHSEPPSAKA